MSVFYVISQSPPSPGDWAQKGLPWYLTYCSISSWPAFPSCSAPHSQSCTCLVNHLPSVLTSGSVSGGSPEHQSSQMALLNGAQRPSGDKTWGSWHQEALWGPGVCPPGTSRVSASTYPPPSHLWGPGIGHSQNIRLTRSSRWLQGTARVWVWVP